MPVLEGPLPSELGLAQEAAMVWVGGLRCLTRSWVDGPSWVLITCQPERGLVPGLAEVVVRSGGGGWSTDGLEARGIRSGTRCALASRQAAGGSPRPGEPSATGVACVSVGYAGELGLRAVETATIGEKWWEVPLLPSDEAVFEPVGNGWHGGSVLDASRRSVVGGANALSTGVVTDSSLWVLREARRDPASLGYQHVRLLMGTLSCRVSPDAGSLTGLQSRN